jgi:hypothetical protein
MKRLLLGALLLLGLIPQARAQDAQVISSCGSPPTTLLAGSVTPLFVDITGKLCSNAAGGGGSPGGLSGAVQFNSSGSFGGITGVTTNGTNLTISSTLIYSGAAVGTQVACLGLDASNNVVKNAAACGSGGGGTPGGATTQLQYNNAGAFGGISGVTSNGTNLTITSTLIYSGAAVGTQVACLGLDGSNNTVKDAAACGTVTSVSAGCGTSSGGSPITATGTIFAAEVPNLRAGTTYTIANADCGTLNNFSNAAAIAVTLPQAGSGGNFANGWYNDVCSIGAGTATITPTTSTIGGVATLVLTTGKCARIVSDGTNYQVVTYGGGGGGGTPGGANTNVQFNNSGAFGGDANFTYAGSGQVTLGGATALLSLPATSGASSGIAMGAGATKAIFFIDTAVTNSLVISANGNGAQGFMVATNSLVLAGNGGQLAWKPGAVAASGGLGDIGLTRGTASYLAVYNPNSQTTATGFAVYNTVDNVISPTNYERGVFDWTTNSGVLTIGTQAAGTGSGRPVLLVSAGLFAAAGPALPACAAGIKGAQAVVSDATAPTYNANYASGGAVVAHVVCNGANWVTQ